MSGIRVLVGTRKGAFVLTSDGKRKEWAVSGPHFAGWEIYHLKGSPADPQPHLRLADQRLVRAGDAEIQRRRRHLGAGGKQVRLRRHTRNASVVRRDTASLGIQARLAPRAVPDRSGDRLRRGRGRGAIPVDRRRAGLGGTPRAARCEGKPLVSRRRRHGPAHHRARPQDSGAHVHRHLGRRRLPHGRLGPDVAPDQQRIEVGSGTPRSGRRGRPLRAPHRDAPVAPGRAVHAEALGCHAHRRRRRDLARGQRQPAL